MSGIVTIQKGDVFANRDICQRYSAFEYIYFFSFCTKNDDRIPDISKFQKKVIKIVRFLCVR